MTYQEGSLTTSDGTELFTRTWLAESPRYEVLLVHGLGEHSGRWETPMSYLVGRGANVYTYDLRGHGLSGGERVDLDSFDQFYNDISETALSTVGSAALPWVLYGHSLGGLQVAGYLMSGRSPEPEIAVLSAPAMDADVPAFIRIAAAVFGRVLPGLRVANSISGEQLSKDPAVGEKYFADELIEFKATARFGKAVFDEQAELSELVENLSTRTLVLHGADDPLVPPSASVGLEASGFVERRVYPTLRHEMHNEPEGPEVMGEVADWIESRLF